MCKILCTSSIVTEQDPMGPSWNRPLPSIPCFSSSLKVTGCDAHFLRCFKDAKYVLKDAPHQMPGFSYLMALSIQSPDLLEPKIHHVNPETPPCQLTVNQSENCYEPITYPGTLLPHLSLKNAFLKPSGESGSFSCLRLLAWCLLINAALAFTTTRFQQIGFTGCG